MAIKNDNSVIPSMLEHLSYDASTGVFRQKKARQGVRVGDVCGTPHSDGYVAIAFKGRIYKAHRMAWAFSYGEWPERNIDHIDGNRSNNAIANLREVDQSENLQNRTKPTKGKKSSKYLGVYSCKSGKKFYASIKYGGKVHVLKYFDSEEEAYLAYLLEKYKHHIDVQYDMDFWNSIDIELLF